MNIVMAGAVEKLAAEGIAVDVYKSANLDTIIEPLVKGGYYHAGQVCVSTQRIYVHDSIINDFTERLIARVKKLRTGDPTLKDTEVGPLITPKEADRIASWIDEAVKGGAKLLTGGKRLSETTLEPTVLVDPAPEARISREEIFGPVAAVIRVKDYEEALAVANDTPFGLSAGIATTSLKHATHFKRNSEAGMVMVNLPTAGVDFHVPFGGRKASSRGGAKAK